jgi:hypothetical protein
MKDIQYKITDTNKDQGWVAITVTFEGGEKYDKRMMVDMTSEETVHKTIKGWLSDYLPLREKDKQAYDPSPLEGKTTKLTEEELKKEE